MAHGAPPAPPPPFCEGSKGPLPPQVKFSPAQGNACINGMALDATCGGRTVTGVHWWSVGQGEGASGKRRMGRACSQPAPLPQPAPALLGIRVMWSKHGASTPPGVRTEAFGIWAGAAAGVECSGCLNSRSITPPDTAGVLAVLGGRGVEALPHEWPECPSPPTKTQNRA